MLKALSYFLSVLIVISSIPAFSVSTVFATNQLGDIVKTCDFDDGNLQGWSARGGSTTQVSVSAETAQSGTNSLKATGSTAGWHGPNINLSSLPYGTYKATGYVKLVSDASSTIKMTHQNGSNYNQIASQSISNTEWNKIEGQFDYTGSMPDTYIILESPSGNTPDIYLDDFTVTYVAEPSPTPSATPTPTSYNYDFESGVQDFVVNGNFALAQSNEAAHNGSTYSLKATARANPWDGPAINTLSKLKPGTTYQISCYVKLASSPASPIPLKLTAQQTPSGGSQTWVQVGSSTSISDTNWYKVGGTFSFEQTMTSQVIYFECATADSYYIDNFSITPMENLSYDFEDGSQGFTMNGSGSLAQSSEAAHNGSTYSLKATGRTNPWDGPSINTLSILKPGATYQISCYVKLASAPTTASTLKLTSQQTPSGGAQTWLQIGSSASISDTNWYKIGGSFTFSQTMTNQVIYAECSTADSYYIDNFEITMTSPPPSPTTTSNATPTPIPVDPNVTPDKLVALTFDDGPDITLTPKVLAKLETYNVPATFMMIGQLVNESTVPVINEIKRLNCEIGNHSWEWSSMNSITAEQIIDSISRTNAAIQQYAGVTPKFFRAPNLATSQTMFDAIDLTFVQGVNSHDYEANTAQQRADYVINGVQDGSIILMHDVQGGQHPTPEALDIIIPTLLNRGYEFVTLSDLFSRKNRTLSATDDTIYTTVTLNTSTSTVTPTATASPTSTPTPTILKTYDFETTNDWLPRGDGNVKLAVATDAYNNGAKSLKITGRSQGWHGPSLYVKRLLSKDGVYRISAYVKLTQTPDSPRTVKLSMQELPVGGVEAYPSISSATISDTSWHQISGIYTYTQLMQDLNLYIESSGATDSYYIDDVVITQISAPPVSTDPTPPPDNSGITCDFENGIQGWIKRIGSEVVTTTTEDKHGGNSSLSVTGRRNSFDGAKLNLFGKVHPESNYILSAWVKMRAGQPASNISMSIERKTAGITTYEGIVSNVSVTSSGWVQLTSKYLLFEDVDTISVYIEASSASAEYLIDDFSLTYVTPPAIQADLTPVKNVINDSTYGFIIGTEVEKVETIGSISQLAKKHFASLVAGNSAKPESISPSEGVYNFKDADTIINFAEANNMHYRFHTLVWHQQTSNWFFLDPEGKEMVNETDPVKRAANKTLLLTRLENYIRTVVSRYGDRVDSWDVVNEVIDDGYSGLRNSKWYQLTGLDFIRTAFTVTKDELEKIGKWNIPNRPKLYINDYNTNEPKKRDALYNLVTTLKAEGVPIDGVGHQTHIYLTQPSVASMIESIKKFGDAGFDNQITELDISCYDDNTNVIKYEESGIPQDVLLKQAYRYKEIFDALKALNSITPASGKKYINNVTLWGVTDENSWLRTFPIRRVNEPLLFDNNCQAKYAYYALTEPLGGNMPILAQKLDAPNGTPVIDGDSEFIWNSVPFITMFSDTSLVTNFKTLWDTNNLYVLAEVADSTTSDNDKVEVFVDENNAKTSSYQADDRKLAFTRSGAAGENSTYNVKEIAGGYRIEAKIPLKAEALKGNNIGFDIRFTDANQQSAIISWNDKHSKQDTETTNFGTLNLSVVNTTKAIKGTPAIDGTMDSIWQYANEFTTNKWFLGTTGSTANVRTMWDNNKLYIYATVTDKNLSKANTAKFEQDSIELFLDLMNDNSPGYSYGDSHYRINFENTQSFGTNTSSAGITSAAKTVTGGYAVEAAINLDIITPAIGSVIRFDFQVNNDDTTAAGRESVAVWNDDRGSMSVDPSRLGVIEFVNSKKDALNNLISTASAIDSTPYTSSSWQLFTSRLEEARNVSLNENASQNDVYTAINNLSAASNNLSTKSSGYNPVPATPTPTDTPTPTATPTATPIATPTATPKSASTTTPAPTKPVNATATSTYTATPIPTPVPTKIIPVTIKPKVEEKGKTLTASIDLETIRKASDEKDKEPNAIKSFVIKIDKVEGVENYTQKIPIEALVSKSLQNIFEIKTPVAEIVVPSNMLSNITKSSSSTGNNDAPVQKNSNIGVSIEKVDISQLKSTLNSSVLKEIGNRPVIDLNAKSDDKVIAWSNPDAPVTVSIEYEPTEEEKKNPELIVVKYLADDGKITTIPSGKYNAATGKVTFVTTHFSKYAVSYVKNSFKDIERHVWAKNQIEVLSSKGVFISPSDVSSAFNPGSGITRGEFISLLVKTLHLSGTSDLTFADVKKDSEYYEAVGIAKKLGIINGKGNSLFNPESKITRQDMMVMVERALKVSGKISPVDDTSIIQIFEDAVKISAYAQKSISTLFANKLIKGDSRLLRPDSQATRAEAAVVLYETYNR